jgi:predicted RNA-binding protein YlqC (UPF0109 family)
MTEQRGDVRALVEQIAKSLVDDPTQVSVHQIDGDTTVLELTVAESDLGKVIGKSGRVARAMRNLVGAAGIRAQKHFELEILE